MEKDRSKEKAFLNLVMVRFTRKELNRFVRKVKLMKKYLLYTLLTFL